MRMVKVILGVLVVLVAAAAGGFVSSARDRAAEQRHEREAARGGLAELVRQRRPVAVERLHAGRNRFAALGVPTRSWSALLCIIDSRDAGIVVQGYQQECRIRAIDVYATRLSPDEVLDRTGLPADQMVIGDCRTSGAAVVYVPGGSPDPAGPCPAPEPGADPAPSGGAWWALVEEERRSSTAAAPGQAAVVVLVDDVEGQLVVDLGCDPWSLLSCNPPPGDPVLPT